MARTAEVNGPKDLIGLTKKVKDKYIEQGLFTSGSIKESDIKFFNTVDKYYRKFILVTDSSEETLAFIKDLYKGITKLYKELLANNSTSDYFSALLTDYSGLEEAGLQLNQDLDSLISVMSIRYHVTKQIAKNYTIRLIDLIRSKTIVSLQELFIKALPKMNHVYMLNDSDIISLCRTDVTDGASYNKSPFSIPVSETEYVRINPKLEFTIREAICITPYLALFLSLEADSSRNSNKILTICRELFNTILELRLDYNPASIAIDKESVLCYYETMHSLIPKGSLPTLADYTITFDIIGQAQFMFITHLVKAGGGVIGTPLSDFIDSLANRLQVRKELIDLTLPTVPADRLDNLTLNDLTMLNESKAVAEPAEVYSNSVTKPKRGRKKKD
nr:MAG TPA: hypothetical protein [Caudoviricetes sp.]